MGSMFNKEFSLKETTFLTLFAEIEAKESVINGFVFHEDAEVGIHGKKCRQEIYDLINELLMRKINAERG